MRRHIAVDDCGRILNPLLVRGQQHGGIAQGAAQALFEWVRYDDDGNPLTTNLADYAIPAASEFPSFEASNTETDSPRNPLGAKGIGESGTIGSTPAVQNAVVDALSHLGVASHRHALHTGTGVDGHSGGDGMKVQITVNDRLEDHDVEARQLLVHFLRETVGLTGTNVGCDTSSCGACTVLIDGESVKSCTVLAVQADGSAITTIEGLSSPDGDLHPMQEAFREHHALQCGYCTPGMVMAAISLIAENPGTRRTGSSRGSRGQLVSLHRLPQHRSGSPRGIRGGGSMIPAAFDYARAGSVSEALSMLAEYGDDAKILAGGHSLIPLMKLRLASPSVLIDVAKIRELSYIRDEGDHVAVGALTRHCEVETLRATTGPPSRLLPTSRELSGTRRFAIVGLSAARSPTVTQPRTFLLPS